MSIMSNDHILTSTEINSDNTGITLETPKLGGRMKLAELRRKPTNLISLSTPDSVQIPQNSSDYNASDSTFFRHKTSLQGMIKTLTSVVSDISLNSENEHNEVVEHAKFGNGALNLTNTQFEEHVNLPFETTSNETYLSKFNRKTILHAGSIGTLYWEFLIVMVTLFNVIFIPIRCAFPYAQERLAIWWYVLDYISDFYYIMDIIIQLRTSFLEKGCHVYNSWAIVKDTLKRKTFYLDIIALIPLDLFLIRSDLFIYQNYIIAVRIFRLLKFYKISLLFERIEARNDNPNLIRIGFLVVTLVTFIHINGCLYFFISTWLSYGVSDWVYPGFNKTLPIGSTNNSIEIVFPENDVIEQILHCLHWSTQMLTTIGEVNAPTQFVEYIYSIVLLLSGVLIFATLVGNVGTILTNLNAARTRFESRLDTVKQYMRNRNIEDATQDKVLKWFDHLWERSKGIDEQETLHNLPTKMRANISLDANREILYKTPIIKQGKGDLGFEHDLVLRLKSELFPPGETIYSEEYIGNDLYIIRSGYVIASQKSGGERTASVGAYFGLECVINFYEFGRHRSETLTTIGFCDILILEKKDLLELLVDYPEVKTNLDEYYKILKSKELANKCENKRVNTFEETIVPHTISNDSGDQDNRTSSESQEKDKHSDVEDISAKLRHLHRTIQNLEKRYGMLSGEYQSLFKEHRRLIEQVQHNFNSEN